MENDFVPPPPGDFSSKNGLVWRMVAIVGLIILGLGFIFFPRWGSFISKKSPFDNSFSLLRMVPEKVSISAAIRVNLPKGMSFSEAKNNISFDPPLQGSWGKGEISFANEAASVALAAESSQVAIFKPSKKLESNRHYAVKIKLSGGQEISSDFLAVDDPRILSIIPVNGSEAPEDSRITIAFNRPMVALTSLDVAEKREVPVEIIPATKGEWKWLGTNTLQFRPQAGLVASANYKVRVKPGFVSEEGLAVEGAQSVFTTRNLRYAQEYNYSDNSLVYNEPFRLYFNQPIDLQKTIREIKLTGQDSGQSLEFIAKHPKIKSDGNKSEFKSGDIFSGAITQLASIFDIFSFSTQGGEEDKSIVEIYLAKDKFGREKIWDFEKNYSLSINKVYPLAGDINIKDSKFVSFKTTNVVQSINFQSPRSNLVNADLFDPQGQAVLNFYEEIDLGKSKISGPNIRKIEYGKHCDPNQPQFSDCQKVDNKKQILLSFTAEKFSPGDNVMITLDSLYNFSGLRLSDDSIGYALKVPSELKIYKVAESNLQSLKICSNNPIAEPSKEEKKNWISSNLDYELGYWSHSYREENSGEVCQIGNYVTVVGVGLMPEQRYVLDLRLKDEFGQTGQGNFEVKTGAMPNNQTSLYLIQSGYKVVAQPGSAKLLYAARNLDYVNVKVCRTNFDFVKGRYSDVCLDSSSKKIDLPKKYWITKYFEVDLDEFTGGQPGFYKVIVTNPDFIEKKYICEKGNNSCTEKSMAGSIETDINLTNLAVAQKVIDPVVAGSSLDELSESQLSELRDIFWVTKIDSQEPVGQAKVELFVSGSSRASSLTDGQGIAQIKPVPGASYALITSGNDSTVLSLRGESFNYVSDRAGQARKFYLYTDKPIYRPGQTINAKGILRVGFDGNYEILPGKNYDVVIYNSKDEAVKTESVRMNDFGTFNLSFLIPTDAPLGGWRICLAASSYDCSYLDVKEYVASPFQVKAESDKEEYVSKDKARISINSDYYFGVPLSGAKFSYTVSSQNYYFDKYDGEWFTFGDWGQSYGEYYYGDRYLYRKEGVLDEKGRANIEFDSDLAKLIKADDYYSKIINFDINVSNAQGQTVSTQKTIIVHAGEFYLGVKADPYFAGKGQKLAVKAKTLDLAGKPRGISNIKAEVFRVEWFESKRQEGGIYSTSWEKKLTKVKEFYFGTDKDGNAKQEFSLAQEGNYEIAVSASDGKGNVVRSRTDVYIWGSGPSSIREEAGAELNLVADKNDYKVGDKGTIVIQSPFLKAKALVAIERGKIFEYKVIDVLGNLSEYSFDVKKEYWPNFYVSVLLQSPQPSAKYAMKYFNVGGELNKLNVEVKASQTQYKPGDEVQIEIITSDKTGARVSADVSLAVVDLSVLALEGNPKKNPLVFFYDGFPLGVATYSNLDTFLEPASKALSRTKGGSGGGGMAADEAAKPRGDFRETAYWQGSIITDNNGYAKISFKLPDNLTTWQAESLGVSKDTKLGVGYAQFISKKDVMVVALKPRFSVPGDQMFLGAQIFNQTKEKLDFEVELSTQGLQINDSSPKRRVAIEAGKSQTVYFSVKSPPEQTSGANSFTIMARAKNYSDGVTHQIPVKADLTYEVVATSNYIKARSATEVIYLPANISSEVGEVSIGAAATLSVFMNKALESLISYPYGCTEQVAGKLQALAVVKKSLAAANVDSTLLTKKYPGENGKEYSVEEMVQIGLARIYNNQRWDGGFSLWPNSEASDFATLSALQAFNSLKSSGFAVNESARSKAADYLYARLLNSSDCSSQSNLGSCQSISDGHMVEITSALMDVPKYEADATLKGKILNIVSSKARLQDKLGMHSLAQLGVLVNSRDFSSEAKKKVNDLLDNSLVIDSRGAFLEASHQDYYYYDNSISDTALYLKSLAFGKREAPLYERALRWVLNSKNASGDWGSTRNNLDVVEAFASVISWHKENDAKFDLELLVNNVSQAQKSFGPKNIFDQFKAQLAMKKLRVGDYNFLDLKKNSDDGMYYDVELKYYLKGRVAPRDEGFTVTRAFYAVADKKNESPLSNIKVGDIVREHLVLIVPQTRRHVSIEDYIPAGMEIVDLSLATEDKSLRLAQSELKGNYFWPEFKEIRDDKAFIYTSYLEPGEYTIDYFLRATTKGEFTQLPAIVSEMYEPEVFGRTASEIIKIH